MRMTQFPACCGAANLSNIDIWAYHDLSGYYERKEQKARRERKGLLLMILTKDQYEAIKILLKEKNWMIFHKFNNPNTGNNLILLGKDLTKNG